MCKKNLLFSVFLISIFQTLWGQISFSSTIPPSTTPLEVCNIPRSFSLTITNNGATISTGGQVSIDFPDGIIYGGTVTGATYVSGSDPAIFNVPNIGAGASASITYNGNATCARINEPVNANTATYTCNLGSFNHTTASYNVSYAALSITALTNNSYYGAQGDVFTREITIYNGGFGRVQAIKIDADNTNGVQILSVSGGGATSSVALPAAATTYNISNFTGIGNGDIYFDNAESIVITETVKIPTSLACYTGNGNAITNYIAYYGCNGNNRCPVTNSTDIAGYAAANVAWYNNPFTANVEMTIPTATIPTCPTTPIVYTINLNNIGLDTAEGGILYISGIEEKYFDNVTFNGTPIAHTVEDVPGSCFTTYPPTAGTRIKVTLPNLLAGTTNVLTVQGIRCTNSNYCYRVNGLGYYNISAELFYNDDCVTGKYEAEYDAGANYAWGNGETAHYGIMAVGGSFNDYLIRDGEKKSFCLTELDLDLPQMDTDGYVEFDIPLVTGLTWKPGNSVTFTYGNGGATHPIAAGYPQKLWTGTDSVLRVRLLKANTPAGVEFFSEFDDANSLCFELTALSGIGCGGGNFAPGLKIVPDPSCSSTTYRLWNCGGMSGPTFWFEHACFDGVNAGTPCEGLNAISFDIKRKSLGYMDADNDNVAGGVGVVDSSKIAWEHTVRGDTVLAAYKGVVYNPNNVANWNHAYIYYPFWGAEVEVAPTYLSGSLSIYDASSGTYIVTNCATASVNTWADSYDTRFFFADLSSCLPSGFTFNQGDSIYFNAYFRFTGEPAWSHTGVVGMQNFVSAQIETDNEPWTGTQFGCSGYPDEYYHHSLKNEHSVYVQEPNGCDDGQITMSSLLYYDQNWQYNETLFPYEVRRPGTFADWTVSLPAGSDFSGAHYKVVNQSGNYSSSYPISPTSNVGGVLTFDMGQIYLNNDWNTPIWGNRQEAYLFIDFTIPCGIGPYNNQPAIFNIDIAEPTKDFLPTLTLNDSYNLTIGSYESILLDVPTPHVYTNSDTLNWNITLHSAGSTLRKNIWLAKKPGISGVTIHKLIRTTDWTGSNPPPQVFLPNANGVFELGDYQPYRAEGFTVIATYTDCIKDSVILIGGYDCDAYPTNISNPAALCNTTQKTLYVSPSTTSLQQIITVDAANDNPHQLCDTLYYQIAVSSVQSGDVKNLKTYFVMSPSSVVQVIPGTSQVEYPHNSGNWYTLQNPALNGSTYCWNISDDPIANGTSFEAYGLTGIYSAPQGENRFNLRFQAVSVPCSFKSGTTFLFSSEGTRSCGDKILATDQITQPVEIPGAIVPHNTYNVVLRNTDAAPCNNQNAVVTFSAKNNGPFISAATEFIDFIVYNGANVSGSLTAIHNAPTGAPTILVVPGGKIYRYAMPAGVLINDSIVFTLPVQVNQNLSCDTAKIRIEANTNLSFNSVCITNGQACTLGQITGQDNDNYINISRTNLSLSGLTAYTTLNPPAGEVLHASVTVTNSGSTPISNANPISVQFYKDSDLNGAVSAGDILLGTETQNVNLAPASSILVNFNQTVAAGTACPLLATILETPCYCNQPLVATTNVAISPDTIKVTACPGITTAPIGSAPITGYTYSWVAITPGATLYLNSINIANPTFNKATNTSGGIESFTYQLYIDRGTACVGIQTIVVLLDIPANCPAPSGTVGNYVWIDTNANGLQDGSENGINNVVIQLYKETNVGSGIYLIEQTTNTNASGAYNFTITESANYYVKFPTTNAINMLTTATTTAATDGNSDANATTGNSPIFNMNLYGTGVSVNNPTIDAGYTCPTGCIPITVIKK